MVTKGYGITIEDIDNSCPKDLEPYEKAYNKHLESIDNLVYMWFREYGVSAVGVAVDHNLNGRKARSEFVESPILERHKYEKEKMKKQRELFVAGLMAMQTNFELSHPKGGRKNEQKSN